MMIGFPGKWPGSAPERAAQCSAWCSSTTMPCASWSTFDAPTRVKAVMDSRIRPSKQYLRSITTTATISAMYFNPRSPCGERLIRKERNVLFPEFQSTLPVRGATKAGPPEPVAGKISIHAPRAGSDARPRRWGRPRCDFNPRSPCGERPRRNGETYRHSLTFQSTLPVRGATWERPALRSGYDDFNPRSPCGERPGPGCTGRHRPAISIHAPRAGSDATQVR